MMMNQMNQKQLLHWIDMVSFAMVDMMLYLDTHPKDVEAIKYFNHYMEQRRAAMRAYAESYGPLTPETARSTDYWDWSATPLPWEGGSC